MITAPELVTVPENKTFKASTPCPYCGGKIRFTANDFTKEDDGTLSAVGVDIECCNEPKPDTKKWEVWKELHGGEETGEPWKRLHDRLVRGLREKFRFSV